MSKNAEILDITGFIGRAAVAFEPLTVPFNQRVRGSNPRWFTKVRGMPVGHPFCFGELLR